MRKYLYTIVLVLIPFVVSAQSRDKVLTIHAVAATGESLSGQPVMVTHTDYQISYGTLKLNAEGTCSVKVYPGNHSVSIERPGYETVTQEVLVDKNTEVTLTLTEKMRQPFAINTHLVHDAYTGDNVVELKWNEEPPVFFDDFESYEPFAISFAPWTGIDADKETAAALVGDYPNRGTMQYAQVINPLEVDPTWWYEYEVLRPYSGKQYVGFTRTMTGNANDDWLISPVLTIGKENVLSFMAKAADKYPERFRVYVTTKTDNPQADDFVQINEGNYESVDYTRWQYKKYDISAYEGKDIRFAIRYLGEYNVYGSFMLMIDDIFVGQSDDITDVNPNEQFVIYLDGKEVGSTYDTHYTLNNVACGNHTVAIKAAYLAAETELTEYSFAIDADDYSKVVVRAEAESKLAPKNLPLSIVNTETAEEYATLLGDDCSLTFASLPKGSYIVSIEEGAFEAVSLPVSVTGDMLVTLELSDHAVAPYNITVDLETADDGSCDAMVKWNRVLSFNDSFEDYPDFATGSFGGWLTIDGDQMPVYPVALGDISNVVTFPGSGTAGQPQPLAPIVFNPWQTVPAMLPSDPAIAPPTGDKFIAFFSPQRAWADKWLISPELTIRDGYFVTFTAKAYSIYPESMEICVSTDGATPEYFQVIAVIDELSEGEWTRYQADLSKFAGKKVRIGIHYTSYDAFFALLDDFTVGTETGEGAAEDFGNVVRYDVTLDGVQVADTAEPAVTLKAIAPGPHTLGVKAIYLTKESAVTEYTFDCTTGITPIVLQPIVGKTYNVAGQTASPFDSRNKIMITGGKKYLK